MVIFNHKPGGVQPPKNPENTFFLGKIFKFQGGSGPPLWIRACLLISVDFYYMYVDFYLVYMYSI